MINKVLLINPPNSMPVDSVRRIGEPLGLLYIGAMLKKHGFQVDVFDMACQGYDNCQLKDGYVTYGSSLADLKKKVKEFQPDLIGVGCMFTGREKNTFSVCSAIKEINRDIVIVTGGLHPSLFSEYFLKSGCIDYVIIGEGEFRVLDLISALNQGRLPDFDGVAYNYKGEYKFFPMSSRIEDLDALPFPERSLVGMDKYINIGVPFAPFSAKKRVAQILTTRGCPNRCNFCSSVNYWGQRIRARSVGNIIDEMRILKDDYNIEEIQFVDDNLTFNREFAKELFLGMKEFEFKWCTPNGLMFNTLDAQMLRLMAESGAYQLSLGIESGSARVLKEIIHKHVRLGVVKQLIEDAHKYDISIHGMFVMGFPGETREEIMQTLDFPFSAGFDSVSFFVVNPLPGSELYDYCVKAGYLNKDFKKTMDFKSANINMPKDSPDYNIDPEELLELVDKKTKEFNAWSKEKYPKRWAKKFERYLNDHPQDNKIILGRVT